MSKYLVIVESPTKAKTITKFLSKDYKVLSSYGHIRDLPNSASEIPKKYKEFKWSRLAIDVDNDFEALYIVSSDKKKRLKEIKDALKNADELLLATDEDREGESISWHLLEELKPKVPVKRLVFHEITKSAIKHSIENSREVDMDLVYAQETRRKVDRLFGYSLSPLLWKKVAPKLSAGRVQSVAMRLLVEKERERIAFKSAEYWDLKANFKKGKTEFETDLVGVGDKKVASGKDFDQNTGKLANKKVIHLDEKEVKKLKKAIEKEQGVVSKVENTPFSSKPYPPFVTSTLQQEGSRKLRWPARQTMQVAQKLYENGFITYMRTDSTTLSGQALSAARNLISEEYGKDFLPAKERVYKTKVKNAQEAHEAVRPAGSSFTSPAEVKKKLGEDAYKLYDLIWKRTVASQMKDAKGYRSTIKIKLGDAEFRASGKTFEFYGFLRAYVEGSDDPEADLADKEKILPSLKEKEEVDLSKIDILSHTTKAPFRYTEGSLIKELERLGIGRPSTWASIVDVVMRRNYAFKQGTALVPTVLAMILTKLMEDYFTKLVDYSFTAGFEDDLDAISRGELGSIKYLNDFYFGDTGLKTLIEKGEEDIDPRVVCSFPITDKIEARIGRYGPFISNGETRASLDDKVAPDELNVGKVEEIIELAEKGPESVGKDPSTGLEIFKMSGRYGPYLQLGEKTEEVKKPKMVSLLPGMELDTVDLDLAIQVISLPKSLGEDPETKEEILVYNGRFGPYLKRGAENRTIPLKEFQPLEMTLENAVELMARPKRGRGRTAAAPLKTLGKNKQDKELVIKTGRYGPYVTDGKTNVSVPKGTEPESITLEQALEMIEAKKKK